MKKYHLIIIGISLVTILVSLFFGMSIQNAQDNFLITHLNIDEGINYFGVNEVPKLSFSAATITIIFLFALLGLELYVTKKTPIKKVKHLAIGALIFIVIILVFAVLTLNNPHYFNFKHFGMIWVILCLNVIFINLISVFVKK
ncbi:MAG TPA: hypothetical protein EYG85_10575 [Crocinitomix sp.]|nr:hypothetical protein [Crocinitomix sp.]